MTRDTAITVGLYLGLIVSVLVWNTAGAVAMVGLLILRRMEEP